MKVTYLMSMYVLSVPSPAHVGHTQRCLYGDDGNHLDQCRQVNADRKCRLMKCLFLQSTTLSVVSRRSPLIRRRLSVRNTWWTRQVADAGPAGISDGGVQWVRGGYGRAHVRPRGRDYSGSAVTDWTNRLIATISCRVSKAETMEWLHDELGIMPHYRQRWRNG